MESKFVCTQCGGSVRAKVGLGRTYEHRPGITLPIPSDFATPTCTECGETHLNDSDAERLEQRLQEAYSMYCRALIDAARERANVTLRELERAAGVTPTYLSHVTSGRKQPSLTLVRLLQAFALHPREVHRHLDGFDWQRAYRPSEAKAYVIGAYLETYCSSLSKKVALHSIAMHSSAYTPSQGYGEADGNPLDSLPPLPPSAEAA